MFSRPPPTPRINKAQPKPLRVVESHFSAAEAKPRDATTRAAKEQVVTARRDLAEVSKPLPSVRWIIPGLDDPAVSGRAHQIPIAPQGELDIDAEMKAAQDAAVASYERHVWETGKDNAKILSKYQKEEAAREVDRSLRTDGAARQRVLTRAAAELEARRSKMRAEGGAAGLDLATPKNIAALRDELQPDAERAMSEAAKRQAEKAAASKKGKAKATPPSSDVELVTKAQNMAKNSPFNDVESLILVENGYSVNIDSIGRKTYRLSDGTGRSHNVTKKLVTAFLANYGTPPPKAGRGARRAPKTK